jgi:hypothetical protein
MNSKTALEVFRLFKMSDKTEEQVVAIIASTLYQKEACRVGMPFLKLEKNILKLMRESFYDEETCAAALKALKMESWTENKILAFLNNLPEGNNRDTVKKLSLSYFKLEEKKEYQIINLLKKVKNDYCFRDPCVKALKLSEKTDEELWSIIELSDFQENICRAAIKCFKDEENILLLMERSETPDHVLNVGAKCIKWEGKSDDKTMHILKRGRYNLTLCEAGITSLKQVSDILFIMEKGHYYNSICDIGIPLLKLDQKDTDELFQIMAESKYDYQICDACLSFLNLQEKTSPDLLAIMARTDFNEFVCMRAITHFKKNKGLDCESAVIDVMRKTNFQTGVCRVGLPLLVKDLSFVYVMESSGYNADVCEIGITLLKDEATIFMIMEKTNFEYKVCEAAVKTMAAIKARIQKHVRKGK